ncbi:acetoin dehydrogenase dihydrolipoyllysine-residue acetyltransferase subunit [Phenylobacterium aquaticum]|uniref:acetoin dehydrogenase dihydrolipoyllysine-residue acetyltransferase subunit n=1 Tax=Phenylobacterium aquaticum TaxID=1763816 RepID=UPI0026EFAD5F|nr:acetoin dehydrogenase dihydrolipoyllysine-residue acetyltransferase subunit [Phenylobacterium aquaticum]
MAEMIPVRMPKWGLSMQEGAITHWWKAEGERLVEGEDLVDIETSKINNVCEAPTAGVLRRIVAQEGETLPVGALMAVVADPAVSDAELDAFIADFQANFTPEDEDGDAVSALALSQVDIGGRTIRIGRAGEGGAVPIVLIHGYSGDLNNWLFNLEALSARGPVVAVDLPGHGGSSKAVGDGGLTSLAEAVVAALEVSGVTKAHLVGHSLGAAVAARIAADRPDLAQSLILIAPASLPGTAVSEAFLTGVIEAQRARDLKPWMEMLVADPAMVTKDMVEDVLKFTRMDGVEDALSLIRDRLVGGQDAADLREDLADIPKALVIASHRDQIVGAPDEAALPPGFRVVWMDDAGHMPHLEKAGEVNALIIEAVG